jgi:hypothetical protein
MTDGAPWYDSWTRVAGVAGGMGLCSVSLSSGFIWVRGDTCVGEAMVWTPERRVPLAFLAAFLAWWGYLLAHRAVTGQFVNSGSHGEGGADESGGPSRPHAAWLHRRGHDRRGCCWASPRSSPASSSGSSTSDRGTTS